MALPFPPCRGLATSHEPVELPSDVGSRGAGASQELGCCPGDALLGQRGGGCRGHLFKGQPMRDVEGARGTHGGGRLTGTRRPAEPNAQPRKPGRRHPGACVRCIFCLQRFLEQLSM